MMWGFWVLLLMTAGAGFCLYFYFKSLEQRALLGARLLFFVAATLSLCWLAANLWKGSTPEDSRLLINNLSFIFLVSTSCGLLSFKKNYLNIVMVASMGLSVLLAFLSVRGNFFPREPLPSTWVWAHILALVVGEFLLFLAAATGFARLWSDYKLHWKKEIPFFVGGSSMVELDRRLSIFLKWGFLFLTIGIVMGLFSAQELWQGEWWSDPKIILALASWMLYFLLLCFRSTQVLQGRGLAWGAGLGFILVLLVVFLVGQWTQVEQWRKPELQNPPEVIVE
jgi:ABC-type uncharacterized transport system permease subunit